MKSSDELENEIDFEDSQTVPSKTEDLPEQNILFLKVILKKLAVIVVLSALLVAFALFWQQRTDFLAVTNAFYFAAFLFFSFGFMIFAANHNIFSPFVYGMKTFGLMLIGRRPKLKYYDYYQDIKNNPLPKVLISFPFLATVPNLLVAIVMHIIFNLYIYVTP